MFLYIDWQISQNICLFKIRTISHHDNEVIIKHTSPGSALQPHINTNYFIRLQENLTEQVIKIRAIYFSYYKLQNI